MARRTPEGPPPPPVVQRLRLRYAKRGRLRFTSHRDFARAFERALRRAEVPMAYSAGFSPHPRISWVGASPTGVASEAEYVEIGLAREVEPEALRAALDEALPPGLDIVEAVEVPAQGAGSLADRMEVSRWRIALPGVDVDTARAALATFLERDEVGIERMTKSGRRTVDVRGPVVSADVSDEATGTDPDGTSEGPAERADVATGTPRAILTMVVRQVTPTVRPDDLVLALRDVGGLALSGPAIAVRQAQGPFDDDGTIGDPLAADRTRSVAPAPITGT